MHLHVDGAPFRAPHALANLVRLFAHWREPLREVLRTNPACRRLATLPEPLVAATNGTPTYAELRAAAAEGELTKYFDVNLTQLLTDTPVRDTVEIRILPGRIEAAPVVDRAALVELLLDRCLDPAPIPPAGTSRPCWNWPPRRWPGAADRPAGHAAAGCHPEPAAALPDRVTPAQLAVRPTVGGAGVG
ncbi:hypothetical protein Ate01nite_45710 [Actinoplanes teichomyceticus]|nr:hypothetical protein Ate01nite_45710 [Actinoplanes teichomyceticus]